MSTQQRERRIATLHAALARRILVLDGATGTYLQSCDLSAEDFGGPEYEGCNEHLVLTRPDVVTGMHEAYLRAGADVGGRLHTGRSRNDQIACDMRLYLRGAVLELGESLVALVGTLLDSAKGHAETVMPGFTRWRAKYPSTASA